MDPPNHPKIKNNSFLYGGLFCLLLVVVAFVTAPMVVRSRKNADWVEAVNNARQIGFALFEFEKAWGDSPNDSTANKCTACGGSTHTLGSGTSNDYFRQLMAADITQSETMFYAKIPNSKKPDNNFVGSLALAKGECGFSYIMGISRDSSPETPVVVTPLVPGKALFDYKAAKKYFSNYAVILRKDGSVQALPIDKSGRVWINGKNLFDPTQPFWNGKPPVIKWPDL